MGGDGRCGGRRRVAPPVGGIPLYRRGHHHQYQTAGNCTRGVFGLAVLRERGITDKVIAASVMFAGVLILYLPLSGMEVAVLTAVALITMSIALRLTRGKRVNRTRHWSFMRRQVHKGLPIPAVADGRSRLVQSCVISGVHRNPGFQAHRPDCCW